MTNPIPPLALSHGQVLWSLSYGAPPTQRLIDEVRYFRTLGIPFEDKELGKGRGKRLQYGYEQLVELGVAIFAVRKGAKPREVAEILCANRPRLRQEFRKAFSEQPASALDADWVKSGGRVQPIIECARFLRIADRYSATAGRFEIRSLAELIGSQSRDDGDAAPRENASHYLINLTVIVLTLVAWALEAPATKPGPQ